MRDLVLRSTVLKSHNPRLTDVARGAVVAEGGSIQIDPEVVDRMDRVRFRNGLVTVHIVLKDEYKPKPPWTERKFKTFNRLMEDILDRVDDLVGEDTSAFGANFEAVEMQPYRGACAFSARVRFVEELLKQPEVAACLDRFNFPPETRASPRELS